MSWNIDSISGRRHAGIGSEYLFVGSPSAECCKNYVEVTLSLNTKWPRLGGVRGVRRALRCRGVQRRGSGREGGEGGEGEVSCRAGDGMADKGRLFS